MHVGTNHFYEIVNLQVRLCSGIKQQGQAMASNKKVDCPHKLVGSWQYKWQWYVENEQVVWWRWLTKGKWWFMCWLIYIGGHNHCVCLKDEDTPYIWSTRDIIRRWFNIKMCMVSSLWLEILKREVKMKIWIHMLVDMIIAHTHHIFDMQETS